VAPTDKDILRESVANGWTILRNGGRATDTWKYRHSRFSEEGSLQTYEREKEKMRQGGLALIGPNGNVVRYYEAPRLRSRW
jgi:hypothetical protein